VSISTARCRASNAASASSSSAASLELSRMRRALSKRSPSTVVLTRILLMPLLCHVHATRRAHDRGYSALREHHVPQLAPHPMRGGIRNELTLTSAATPSVRSLMSAPPQGCCPWPRGVFPHRRGLFAFYYPPPIGRPFTQRQPRLPSSDTGVECTAEVAASPP
jgi:hypothetical protein